MNHYQTLGVSQTANLDEIKKAYRRLASQHHPDRGGDTAKFQEIQAAYDILSNQEKRAQYDNPAPQMHSGFPPGFEDIFSQFGFGHHNPFEAMRNAHSARRNKDIRVEISVPLVDTLEEQNKTLTISSMNSGTQTVNIKIPRGITSGTVIRYPGLGDHMFENLPRADLYLTIHVQSNPAFQISGLNLITELTINCFQAILGCEKVVRGLDGKEFTIQTPKFCQPGTKLKISGEGLYGNQSDVKGHLFVQVNVNIPNDLDDSQLQLIETLNQPR